MSTYISQVVFFIVFFFQQFFCAMSATFSLNFMLSGLVHNHWGALDQPGLINFGIFRVSIKHESQIQPNVIEPVSNSLPLAFKFNLLNLMRWYTSSHMHVTIRRLHYIVTYSI